MSSSVAGDVSCGAAIHLAATVCQLRVDTAEKLQAAAIHQLTSPRAITATVSGQTSDARAD